MAQGSGGFRQVMGAAVLAASLAVTGCGTALRSPATPTEPAVVAAAPPTPETAASAAMRGYFAQVQMSLLSQGLLRTDGGGEDAPFTDRNLTENFLKIALYEEYARGQVTTTRSQSPIHLQRWARPIRVQLVFGPSVPGARQASDRARVTSFLDRLCSPDRPFHHRDRPEPQLLGAFRLG